MFNGDDFDGVVELAKADPIVSDAQPEFRRFDSFEPLDISLAGKHGTSQGVKNADRVGSIDSAKLGAGAFAPDNLPWHVATYGVRRSVAYGPNARSLWD